MSRTLDYPTVNLNLDHNARPSQTDRRTDGQTSWQ